MCVFGDRLQCGARWGVLAGPHSISHPPPRTPGQTPRRGGTPSWKPSSPPSAITRRGGCRDPPRTPAHAVGGSAWNGSSMPGQAVHRRPAFPPSAPPGHRPAHKHKISSFLRRPQPEGGSDTPTIAVVAKGAGEKKRAQWAPVRGRWIAIVSGWLSHRSRSPALPRAPRPHPWEPSECVTGEGGWRFGVFSRAT